MAAGKEIRTQIKSIGNTQKITRAMQMVAASKMRKCQERMQAGRPYTEKMQQVIAHLASAHPEYKHPFLIEREAKRVGYIVVSTDRGLCGGLNINMFRTLLAEMEKWRKDGVEMDICAIGSKATHFFRRLGANLVGQASNLGDIPSIEDLIGTVKVMLDAYRESRIDRLFVVLNLFVNSMTQQPHVEQLLPRIPSDEEEVKHHWDYIYEPDSKEVLDHVLDRYIESLVYQAVVENIASEQAARMVAMQAATDNAGKIIEDLGLAYNKARQASITQELTEIVSGAAAV